MKPCYYSRLTREPPQIWRVAMSAGFQRCRAKLALALRLSEAPDSIGERFRTVELHRTVASTHIQKGISELSLRFVDPFAIDPLSESTKSFSSEERQSRYSGA